MKTMKHLKKDLTHQFISISNTPENFCKCRFLETYFIKAICSTLNKKPCQVQLTTQNFLLLRKVFQCDSLKTLTWKKHPKLKLSWSQKLLV